MANVPLIQEAHADLAAWDMEAIGAAFTEDIRRTASDGIPYGGTYVGLANIVAGVFSRVADDWDDFRHESHQTADCGDDILVSGAYHGTWKPTQGTIEASFVHHWTLRDGKVSRFHQYVDLAAMLAATDGFVYDASAPTP